MKFRVSGCAFVLLFVLQLSNVGGDQNDRDQLILMNKKIENFIKQILQTIRSYNKDMRGNPNCIPDDVMESAMETLKRSIDCVDSNEKEYAAGRISTKMHRKQFLTCFTKAKEEVRNRLINSTFSGHICPEKLTEKTYEINVTTALTKTLVIRIKNGVNVTSRKFQFSHLEEMAPEGKEDPKTLPGPNSLEEMEAEKKPAADLWKKPNSTVSDDIYVDQKSTNGDDECGDEKDEMTTKDAVESGEEQGSDSKSTTIRSLAAEGDSEEEYDYDGF